MAALFYRALVVFLVISCYSNESKYLVIYNFFESKSCDVSISLTQLSKKSISNCVLFIVVTSVSAENITTVEPSTATSATTQPSTATTATSATTQVTTTPTTATSVVTDATQPTETTGTTGSVTTVITTPTHCPDGSHFDAASFVGGIILCAGLFALGFIGYKIYKSRTSPHYQQF